MTLTTLFAQSLEGYDPRIAELGKQILMAGMSVKTNLRNSYRDVPVLGKGVRIIHLNVCGRAPTIWSD
jgi:hypothetical protein